MSLENGALLVLRPWVVAVPPERQMKLSEPAGVDRPWDPWFTTSPSHEVTQDAESDVPMFLRRQAT